MDALINTFSSIPPIDALRVNKGIKCKQSVDQIM